MKKPEGHTLYWVYAWDAKDTEYNFDTTTRIDDARNIARDMITQDGWHHVQIFFGDEDGALTQYDPVEQFK